MPRPRRRAPSGGGGGSKAASKVLQPGVSSDDRVSFFGGGGGSQSPLDAAKDGKRRTVRLMTTSTEEEGVLYTVKVTHPPKPQERRLFGASARNKSEESGTQPPQSEEGRRPTMIKQPQQYTITKIKTRKDTWAGKLCRLFGVDVSHGDNVDSYLYKPTKPLLAYIYWTFSASFGAVFITFLAIFIILCLIFAGLFALAGEIRPECIIVSGEMYGTNSATKFGDAFALSWTTFTTVGYGNTFAATGTDYMPETHDCSGVVFLCTVEAFMGLIYAGMCTAIMFGKVNRVQSHAHLTFAHSVCLQYEEVDMNDFVDEDSIDSDFCDVLEEEGDDEEEDVADNGERDEKDANETISEPRKSVLIDSEISSRITSTEKTPQTFKEKFKGCPVLKFQVVNDFCNKGGGEIIDGFMKVVGIKQKRQDGVLSHSQYVRVNLVDYEHPFFGRVWHGVHILDQYSPLLTGTAKEKVRENGGWPEEWLQQPSKIRKKLDFQTLVLTLAGVSNVSACTVHAYKRYKFEDVIIGFDFSPLVYEDMDSGKLKVNLDLVNDVREQHTGHGEDLKSGTTPIDTSSHHSRKLSNSFTLGGSTIFKKSDSNTFD